MADPSRLNFSSPDRRLRSSGPPIARGRSLSTGGPAIPRPRVAGQLRLLISGESRGREVATLAADPLIASHTGSIAGQLGLRRLWELTPTLQQLFGSPVTDVSAPLRLAGHRPFGYPGWAAEVGVLQKIDGLNNSVSQAEADNWATAMLSHCEEVCPRQFHVKGADHTHWFADLGFSGQNLGQAGSATVVHGYAYWTGALDH